MSDVSTIEWTEATLNPWTGCTKVSPGCAHCYIDRTPPFRINGRKFVGGHIPLVFHMDRLERMVRRRKPTLYFVNSLSDLFHEDASDEAIAVVFAAMAAAPQHTFQVLTKRPERMRDVVSEMGRNAAISEHIAPGVIPMLWPLPNVWLGVTIENRRFVDRADLLRQTPAAVRFISAEPLLGPLVFDSDMGMVRDGWPVDLDDDHHGVPEHLRGDCYEPAWLDGADLPELDLDGIDWLIVGGESGKKHRPVHEAWIRDLRASCVDTGTAFFFKQWGGATPKSGGRELDGRTWDEMPEVSNRG